MSFMTPNLDAAVKECITALGAVRARQIECFVRMTLALSRSPREDINPLLAKGLMSQLNQMFQIGLFQHDFETPLSTDQDKWVQDVLLEWLNKLTDAAGKDRKEFRVKTANGGNKANDLDELLTAITKALSTPSETKH